MPTNKEEIECIAFSQWLHFRGLKHAHIANEVNWGGFKKSPQAKAMAARIGAKMKKMGKSAGTPDYVILTPKGVLFIEMKEPGKKLKGCDNPLNGWKEGQKTRGGVSLEQKEWMEAINAVPLAQAEVCYGVEEAIKCVQRILEKKPLQS